jgi:hypothetical protein
MDPLSTPLISESENDFEVNIEQQAATLNLWDTGFGILVTIMVVAATFFSITLLILFVLGSFYVASSIWNWLFPPITASSERLKGYQEGFSKAAEKASEAIANLTSPQEAKGLI